MVTTAVMSTELFATENQPTLQSAVLQIHMMNDYPETDKGRWISDRFRSIETFIFVYSPFYLDFSK